MHLEILKHDGPARLGKLHINEQKVLTPSLLWTPRAGPAPPSSIIIHPSSNLSEAPANELISYGTIFSQPEISGFGILPTHPSGFDLPLELAENAVEETLHFAEKFPGFGAVVEGGRYLELRMKCAHALKDRPILKIANSEKLIKNHRRLVEVVTMIRETVTPNTALYMSGVPPHLFPVLAYMGVDLFDLKVAILGAYEQMYLMANGTLDVKKLTELPCPCPNCASTTGPPEMDVKKLISHNIQVSNAAIREVRESIRTGVLRNLVEERASRDLNAMGALRIMDKDKQSFLEKYTPVSRPNQPKEETHRRCFP